MATAKEKSEAGIQPGVSEQRSVRTFTAPQHEWDLSEWRTLRTLRRTPDPRLATHQSQDDQIFQDLEAELKGENEELRATIVLERSRREA